MGAVQGISDWGAICTALTPIAQRGQEAGDVGQGRSAPPPPKPPRTVDPFTHQVMED
jgi:hypothetical protein